MARIGKKTIKRWHHKQCLLQSWNRLRFNQWDPQESEGTRPDHQQGGCENFMRKQPNRQIRKYRGSNSYTAPLARFEYQIDIMDMIPLIYQSSRGESSRQERWAEIRNGCHWHLQCKLANVIHMKEKTGPNALSAKRNFQENGISNIHLQG
jgi:hypothetical protein